MKKREFILAVLVFLFNFGYSKSGTSKSNLYYGAINKAELFICNFNPQKAYQQYIIAYKYVKEKMPSQDLYNMFICCLDKKDYINAKMPLRLLKCRGWHPEIFNEILKYYTDTEKKSIQTIFDEIKPSPIFLDTIFLHNVDSMMEVDQSTNKYLRSINNGLITGPVADSFANMTVNNLKYLNTLFSSQFPAEYLIGNYEGNPNAIYPYYVIFLHNMQASNNSVCYNNLYKAVKNIAFMPEYFEYLVSETQNGDKNDTLAKFEDISIAKPLFPIRFYTHDDSLLYFNADELFIEKCNRERKKIVGLETVEELKQKIIFQYYYPKYNIVRNYDINEWYPFFEKLRPKIAFATKPLDR